MYESMHTFQNRELTDDELAAITGGLTSGLTGTLDPHARVGGTNIGQMGPGACSVCRSSLGVLAIGSSGMGPFVSAFNNITINNGIA
jgi:bacteriocin-like protein